MEDELTKFFKTFQQLFVEVGLKDLASNWDAIMKNLQSSNSLAHSSIQ